MKSKAAPLTRRDLLTDVPVRSIRATHTGRDSQRSVYALGNGARGVSSHLIYERRRAETPDDIPPPDILRDYIKSQMCWWCERGPWKMLAGHTSAHGITAADLRRLAGLVKHASICSPEVSAFARTRPQCVNLSPLMQGPTRGQPREISEAGLQSMRARLDAARNPEQARRAGRAVAAKRWAASNHYCHACLVPLTVPHRREGRRAARSSCGDECRRFIRSVTAIVLTTETRRRRAR